MQAQLQQKVGATIRRLRKAQGYTQDAFADRCGLHRAHMGEIERGEANVTLQTLKTVSDALGLKVAELLKGC